MVISPEIYKEQVEELGIEGLEISPESREEALELIKELEYYLKNLKKIRYNLHVDMRLIRKEYLDEIRKLDKTGDLKKRRQIIDRRDELLGPYEGVERLIDNLIDEIDKSIIFLREYAGIGHQMVMGFDRSRS